MVKISNLTIKNFKFYINETIDINEQNFLIYGENGVGKSSLFGSLYYLLYGYFDNGLVENIQEFTNRDSDEDDGLYEPKVLKEKNYLSDTQDAFDNLDYEQCGNLLRKEIERIIAHSTFLFRTGKKETLEDAIRHIRQRNRYYVNSNSILEDMNMYYERFKIKQFSNPHISVDRKLEIMMQKLDKCFKNININSDKLKQILKNVNFYQTITNQASHYESDVDYHKIEYQEALKDVEKLKDIFNNFNKIQNK